MTKAAQKDEMSQSDKFKEAERKHGADEDEAAWDKRIKKVVMHKPVPEKPAT